MNLSIFKSFFKSRTGDIALKNSEIFKNLKEMCQSNGLMFYQEKTIYHHTKKSLVPLLVVDPMRGIYIFEHKTWSYDTLKNATAKNSKDQTPADNTLAFDKIKEIIKTKFKELTHTEGIDTFNFLLMENLSTQEYEHLDPSLQKLLPEERIIFSDSTQEDMIEKLQNVKSPNNNLPDATYIVGNLLIQYLILSDDDTMHMATQQQMDFIDAKTSGYQVLYGENGSGRTSSILLKSILYKLENPNNKVIIISPTVLSCDILKKRLLNIVEHAIIELDLTSIEIITPIELLNKHLNKYNKKPLESEDDIYIDTMLMKKRYQNTAQLLICDDSDLLPNDFISYLKHIQNKDNLILVTNKHSDEASFAFEKKIFQNLDIKFIQTNPHAKALQLISKLLKENNARDILVVSNQSTKEKLDDDLEFFIKDEPILLDSSKKLIDQNLDNILLVTHDKTSAINARFVIVLDVCEASKISLMHAIGSAQDTVYLLYEHNCEQIENMTNTQKEEI